MKNQNENVIERVYKSGLIANKVKSGALDSTGNIQTKLVSFYDSIM